MLAAMIRETPAAIEKNAVAEGMSRMRGRGLEAHYRISRASQGERNSPLQDWLGLQILAGNPMYGRFWNSSTFSYMSNCLAIFPHS